MIDDKRRNKGEEHHSFRTTCIRGHEKTGDNLIVTKDGQRKCRICTLENQARANKRNAERARKKITGMIFEL